MEAIDGVPAGADARRDVRRARLLRRQGAARADAQGRAWRTRASRSSTSSRRASPSTITRARPRATPTRARRTSKSCRPTSCRRRRQSPPSTSRARSATSCCTTAAGCGCARSPRTTTRPIAIAAYAYIRERQKAGEVATGLSISLAGLERPARAEQHGRDAARPAAVRGAVPGQRRARKAAAAIPDRF